MPLVDIESLPDDARVWVFGSSKDLDDREQHMLLQDVDAWLARWKAHGHPLTVGRALTEGRFLTIAVDQRTAGASGCSIDGLFRALQDVELAIGTSLVAGGRVFYRDAAGATHSVARDEFTSAARAGLVTSETPVFDTTVQSLGAWRSSFERTVASSWHASLL